MEEIWSLQPRFEQSAKRRVFALLAHPRFRAAYDFLLLRAAESEVVAALGLWWTQAQELDRDLLAERLQAAPPQADGAARDEAPPRRKRRRGRRRGGGGTVAAGPGDGPTGGE
jgi:poly(A) polymerase